MPVLKNKTDKPIPIGHVTLDPHQQLTVHPPYSDDIQDALDKYMNELELIDDTPTPAELKADADAIQEGVDKMGKIVGD